MLRRPGHMVLAPGSDPRFPEFGHRLAASIHQRAGCRRLIFENADDRCAVLRALWIGLLRRVVGFQDGSTGLRRPRLLRSCGTDGRGEMPDESGLWASGSEGEANA